MLWLVRRAALFSGKRKWLLLARYEKDPNRQGDLHLQQEFCAYRIVNSEVTVTFTLRLTNY